ncbi:MAG: protein-glutamate O-methyltransferase CheR [Sinobacterium sp.]|nr:protein-glutamate O-methyltransferase CheR [Sinobacterium sp.]
MASAEMDLNSKNFNFITNRVYAVCGITLNESKFEMVRRRLTNRIKSLGMTGFDQYLSYLDKNNKEEEPFFINSITTNFTSFFRENHHFEYIENVLIPMWLKEKRHDRQIKIWSAGCSSGEEPYTIAMTLMKHQAQLAGWDIKILATDIDTNILDKAREGCYLKEKNESLPPGIKKNFFNMGSKTDKTMRINDDVKKMIHFKRLNFLDTWPMKKHYDLIFCRNVIIYFDKETQATILKKFSQRQTAGSHLFIGHSESLYGMDTDYDLIGKAIYKKVN